MTAAVVEVGVIKPFEGYRGFFVLGCILMIIVEIIIIAESALDNHAFSTCTGKYNTPKCVERYEAEKAQVYEERLKNR